MTDSNLDVVLRGIELWNAGHIEDALEVVHSDLEWRPGEVFPDFDDVYRGHEGLLRFWEEFSAPFDAVLLEPLRRHAEGDDVVIEARFEAQGREGVEVEMVVAQRYQMRHGKLVRFEAYSTWDEAMAAAGLD
jgi:ketosteroid isomerase-like protein